MENKVTISANDFSLVSQQPTGNVRSGLVGSVPTRIITSHQAVTPKGQPAVTRSIRKVEQTVTTTIGGVAVTLPVTVSLTTVVPDVLPAASLDAGLAVLQAWMSQDTFAAQLRNQEI